MNDAAELKRQTDQVVARLLKRERMTHVRWHDGHLEATIERTDRKPEPGAPITAEPKPTKRGIVQAELEL
jgi:hypothetical protein